MRKIIKFGKMRIAYGFEALLAAALLVPAAAAAGRLGSAFFPQIPVSVRGLRY